MDFCKCHSETDGALSIAMAAVPMQKWETTYDISKGLKQGTIFPCLDLPFYVTGGEGNG